MLPELAGVSLGLIRLSGRRVGGVGEAWVGCLCVGLGLVSE